MVNQRLTLDEKKEILSFKGKKSARLVAEDYGVSHTAVYNIWNNGISANSKDVKFTTLQDEFLLGIIRKMIPPFVKNNVKGVILNEKETQFMGSLVKEVMSNE